MPLLGMEHQSSKLCEVALVTELSCLVGEKLNSGVRQTQFGGSVHAF
jgi:hypothetical protein